jgi:hypothetical protein
LKDAAVISWSCRIGIPPKKLLNARHGTDFPMSPEEMVEHLRKAGRMAG